MCRWVSPEVRVPSITSTHTKLQTPAATSNSQILSAQLILETISGCSKVHLKKNCQSMPMSCLVTPYIRSADVSGYMLLLPPENLVSHISKSVQTQELRTIIIAMLKI